MLDRRLTIRPPHIKNESLTSYILRSASINGVPIEIVWQEVNQFYKRADLRNIAYLDILPEKVTSLNLLQEMFGLDTELIHQMTFTVAHKIFLNESEITQSSNSLFQNYLETRYRKFCIDCLKEKISYNLFWQIKEINTCTRHNKLLSLCCNSCNKQQPYLSNSLFTGTCHFCNMSLLSLNWYVIDSVNNKALIENNSNIYVNWNALFDIEISSMQEIHQDKSKALAIRLFFLLHKKEDPFFSMEAIEYLSKDFKYRLLNLIRDQGDRSYRVTISKLFEILKLKRISLRDFLSLEVDLSFIHSIQYPATKAIPRCQAPWCNSYGELNSLKEVKSLNARKGRILMCIDCCNKYYYDKESHIWEEVEDLIKFGYFKVLPLLKQRLSTVSIALKLDRSRNYISKIISYLASQKLIDLKYIGDLTIKGTELIDIFNDLYQNKGPKVELARKKYGISLKEFYYHYYSAKVQQFIYLKENEKLYIKISCLKSKKSKKLSKIE